MFPFYEVTTSQFRRHRRRYTSRFREFLLYKAAQALWSPSEYHYMIEIVWQLDYGKGCFRQLLGDVKSMARGKFKHIIGKRGKDYVATPDQKASLNKLCDNLGKLLNITPDDIKNPPVRSPQIINLDDPSQTKRVFCIPRDDFRPPGRGKFGNGPTVASRPRH